MVSGGLVDAEYLGFDAALLRDAAARQDVLGIALFAATPPEFEDHEVPIAFVATPPLGPLPAVAEVWRAPGPFRFGQLGPVRYRSNHQLLFGCLSLRESADLGIATARAYEYLFQCIDTVGFPHLLRVWNYLPEINSVTHGTERYRQFNAARQQAFLASHRPTTGNVPAACALGSVSGSELTVYFLSSQQPGLSLENPRQIAAYHYPPQYGAISPTFCRATLVRSQPLLLVSGTASIVGHNTMHVGDVIEQTRESVANIRALAAEANSRCDTQPMVPERLLYKVYLRHAHHLAAVTQELRSLLGPHVSALFLQAEVCREQLLVEIEAVSRAQPSA